MRAHRRPVAGLEPIPLGLHARRGRSAAPATEGLLSALPVRLHNPAAAGIHGLTPSDAHPYRNRLLGVVPGGRRYSPYAFTEQGVAMLSSVLRSDRAVAVNIEIMRTFVALRRVVEVRDALRRKLDELEKYAELVSKEALHRLAALGWSSFRDELWHRGD